MMKIMKLRNALLTLATLAGLALAPAAHATSVQWDINRGVNPSPLCLLNGSTCQVQVGSVDWNAGLFTITANQVTSGTFGGTYVFAGPSTTIIPSNGWSAGHAAKLLFGDANNFVGATNGGAAYLAGFNGAQILAGSGGGATIATFGADLSTTLNGTLTINPGANITALNINESYSGSTVASFGNLTLIGSDGMNTGTGSGNGFAPWQMSYFFGGSTMTGGRTMMSFQTTMTAQTSASNGNRQYNTFGAVFFANATDGGTGTTSQGVAKGAVGAANFIVIANSSATNMAVVGAFEVNTSIQAGASSWYKFGIAVANGYNDATRATVYDGGYVLGRIADASVTWKYGYAFFDVHGLNPLGTDSIAMGSIGTSVIGSFFDFPNYSCNTNILRINTVYAVDCSGSLTAGSVPIARIAATGTPSSTTFLRGDGTWSAPAGGGTVTSVGLSVTGPLYTVSGSPVTGAGTLTATINTQAANLIFVGPASGAAAAPTFRSLVAADMPAFTGGDATSSAGSVVLTLGANVVTYAKFQQVAASSIVGNPTGSLANAQGITLGPAFGFSAGVLITQPFTGDVTTPSNSVVTTVVKVNGVAYGASPSTNTVPVVTGANTVTYEAVPNAALANSTISGVALGGNLFTLTFGTHITGTSYNGSAAVTIATDAASANTVSTIVARDGSGNFSAGTISAALTGHASLDCALTGCTMSGAIAMGGNNITGAGTIAATNYTGTFAGNTWTTGTGTLTITAAKTLSISNTLTLAGTDGSTLNVGVGGTLGSAAFVNTGTSGGTVPLNNTANVFSADQRVNGNIFVNSATEKVWNSGGTIIVESGANAVFLRASSVNALSVIGTQVTIASGVALQLGTAFVTTAPAATGTITMKDNTGTSYRFLVVP